MIGEDLGDQKCWETTQKIGKTCDLDMGFMGFMGFIADLMGFIADLMYS